MEFPKKVKESLKYFIYGYAYDNGKDEIYCTALCFDGQKQIGRNSTKWYYNRKLIAQAYFSDRWILELIPEGSKAVHSRLSAIYNHYGIDQDISPNSRTIWHIQENGVCVPVG